MAVRAYIRGNPVQWIEDEDGLGYWGYLDGVIASRELDFGSVIENRCCPMCGLSAKGADPCMGYLPGVQHGCCGHGIEPCYVVWEHGVRTVGQTLDARKAEKK